MKLRIALLASPVLAGLALSACEQAAEAPVVAETTTAENVVVAPTEAKLDTTLPGAQSEFAYAELLALEANDGTIIADSTKGAGLCVFMDEGGRALLTAGAPTQEEKPGAAVVRPNGQAATALYAQSGGTEYLLNGPTFVREGADGTLPITAIVLVADDKASATLTLKFPDGERDPYTGKWSCSA
ncbi:hypothetical protein [Croceicoccus bisphenolivorans]|uniref:hypothetical protein n=1 Tax=Croceicoccus bisphenolivorans TaxID=1783232 RepID=UPI00082F0FCF|nr:hypothetical protein [Croceicoccus bisphenolivorans]